jgi:hypothetical protein
MKTTRTDPHRPGAIIPVDYEYVLWYSFATMVDGWPQPSSGVNCELDRRTERLDANGKLLEVINGKHNADGRCCVVGLHQAGLRFAKIARESGSSTGKCDVCGAHFVYGEVWQHTPTGELIHIGHDCADKYNLVADRTAWEQWHATQKRERATAVLAREKAKARDAFILEHAGLAEAFDLRKGDGKAQGILSDLYSKLHTYGSLSEKQIAFALKLAAEIKNPPPPEKHVPAPTGRVTFDGEIVGVKTVDGLYGETTKITVKVTTPDGTWLAWLTAPNALFSGDTALRGRQARFTATLTRSDRDEHFAFGKRPVVWTEEGIRLEAEKAARKAARTAKKTTVITQEATNA